MTINSAFDVYTKLEMDIYEHYKGGRYGLIGIATHTETNEKLVVYKNISGDLFVRPYDMFFGKVEVNGELVDRFTFINPRIWTSEDDEKESLNELY